MKKIIKKYYISILVLLLLGYSAKINWSDGQWENVIRCDARGYYAYLPATFIYKDLNFGFYQESEIQNTHNKKVVYDYRYNYNGHTTNKYFVGESILLAPFFLTAHLASSIAGQPTDGYSQFYSIAVTIAALFYLFIGLIFLKKTLKLFDFNEVNIFIVIVSIILGTNLFYYSIVEVGMSHVYSFSMVSIFIYYIAKYFRNFQQRHLIYAAIILGIIILIRPMNILVTLSIPFLSQNWSNLKEGLQKYYNKWRIVILTFVIVLLIPFIQLIIYKIQTGSFIVYSYGEEGFDLTKLNILDFLFSYKKGFFLYTPICLFASSGFFFIKQNKFIILSLLGFLLSIIYFLSSWWNWYYGGSFSSRVMIEYLPFFAILLGFLLNRLSKKWVKLVCLGTLLILIIVNQIQTLQYRYNVIHWSEMDKKKYWDVFLDLKPIIKRKVSQDQI